MTRDGRGPKVIVIGAGPAGLTAAYQLGKAAIDTVVLEKDTVVGGLARTVHYKGYHFDIGGHRFFTKVRVVDAMWHEVLGDGKFLRRPRLSRIYYDKKFFHYPLRAGNALRGLGLWNSCLILLSYLRARLFPDTPEETFEQWVSNRFGTRLYRTFFKAYTEKVWGIPCSEIRAEWAAQRIKALSLFTAVKNALLKQQRVPKEAIIRTLIDEFHYPERGPGMMWDAVRDLVQKQGGRIELGADVHRIVWSPGRVDAVEAEIAGRLERVSGTHYISTMPIRELVEKLDPPAPAEVWTAAHALNYRDFLTVALVVDKADLFPDNWIYIHDPDVKVGRIQNFKNWSPHMVPNSNKTCLGLEYFCFEGDGLWTMSDRELVELGKRELERLGLARATDIEDGTVVRMPKAYPVYDAGYASALGTIRGFLSKLGNLQLVGRNGMHKYNNQDHSMLTAILAVRNILGRRYDLWLVNVEQEYHEEGVRSDGEEADEVAHLAATERRVPERVFSRQR